MIDVMMIKKKQLRNYRRPPGCSIVVDVALIHLDGTMARAFSNFYLFFIYLLAMTMTFEFAPCSLLPAAHVATDRPPWNLLFIYYRT